MAAPRSEELERFEKRCREQKTNLFARLQTAATRSKTHALKHLKTGGDLSVIEWRILWDLYEAGPLTVQQLSDIQRTDHSLVSRAIPGMRAKGLVSTMRGVSDKRQSLVQLDEAGRQAYLRAAPNMEARRQSLADAFTAGELQQFVDLIDKYEAYLEASQSAASDHSTD